MPEGPEIARMQRKIAPHLTNQAVVLNVLLKHKKFNLDHGERLIIESVDRVGKRLGINCGAQVIAVGAGMTGHWRIAGKDSSPQQHDIFEFVRSDGERVVYNDVRRFGGATYRQPDSWAEDLGPDFTDPRLLQRSFVERLFTRARGELKPVLLDQARIAGIGNVYASELCWHLRVNPFTPIGEFTRWRALGTATHRMLCRAIAGKGVRDGRTTVKYQKRVMVGRGYVTEVYDQPGMPCYRCATPIEQATQAGRSTYWCPTCQPET